MREKCPTCESPSKNLHPAVQHEGEVHICGDAWHGPLDPRMAPAAALVERPDEDVSVVRQMPEVLAHEGSIERAILGLRQENKQLRQNYEYFRSQTAAIAVRAQAQEPLENAVTRLEVIAESGRVFTRWDCHIEFSYQDQGRTLKIFVSRSDREREAENP